MKIALRIIISGLIVALIVVLCVFVFFKPNNALTAYNTLNAAFKEDGAIGTMQRLINESEQTDKPLNDVLPNYEIIEYELDTLRFNYAKMLLYSSDGDASESLNKKANELIEEVKDFTDEISNYKLTIEGGASDNAIAEIEAKLNLQILNQVNLLSDLNIIVFENLNEGYYKGCYTYKVAMRAIASIKSVGIDNADPSIKQANLTSYLQIYNESNNQQYPQTFEGAYEFLNNLWELDLVKLFTASQEYVDSLDETNKAKANYALDYISQFIVTAEV